MTDDQIFDVYWKQVLGLDQITPSELDKKYVMGSFGFQRYRFEQSLRELEKSLWDGLPKWAKKLFGELK